MKEVNSFWDLVPLQYPGASPEERKRIEEQRAINSRMLLIDCAIGEKLRRGESVPVAWSRELGQLKRAQGVR